MPALLTIPWAGREEGRWHADDGPSPIEVLDWAARNLDKAGNLHVQMLLTQGVLPSFPMFSPED